MRLSYQFYIFAVCSQLVSPIFSSFLSEFLSFPEMLLPKFRKFGNFRKSRMSVVLMSVMFNVIFFTKSRRPVLTFYCILLLANKSRSFNN